MLKWDLMNILTPDNGSKVALIVLNQPLQSELHLLKTLWKKAVLKVCVDGGTNELYDNTVADRDTYLPDLITGDFDSVREDVLQCYRNKNVEIISTPDQDYTDFTKCLKIVLHRQPQLQVDCVVAIGAFGGRLDQQFANYETLFVASQNETLVPVYLMSTQSLACLLQKGSHVLHVDSGLEGDHCGLIPLAGRCQNVTTTGLKWNLDHQAMGFGELISTSNTWNGEKTVTIKTDSALLWTMCINCDLLCVP